MRTIQFISLTNTHEMYTNTPSSRFSV